MIPPIHQTSTFVQPAPGEFVEDYDYSRSANPTRAALERALGELEGGHGAAFSSGMAATHALLTAALDAGDHLILPLDLYGGTYRLVDKVLARFGLAYDLVDQTDIDALRAALRPETRLIWVETPTNPLLNEVDIAAVVEAAEGRLVVVDNTFATPDRPAPARARRDAPSCTRPPSTSAATPTSSAARSITADEELPSGSGSSRTRSARCPAPFDCFLVHRGLRTLGAAGRPPHRERRARSASGWARRPGVEDVRWPGLRGHGLVPPPRRVRDRRAGPSSSRSPSRWAGSSR